MPERSKRKMNTMLENVARSTMKRARRGLFGNTGKLFGNNVSHSERKHALPFPIDALERAAHGILTCCTSACIARRLMIS